MASEWAAAARLVRRTGFGATGDDVDAAVKEGAAKYVARVLAADPDDDAGAKKTAPPSFPAVAQLGKDASRDAKKQRQHAVRGQDQTLTAWWLDRMLAVEEPFGEKLTFVWHSHFATSLQKVKTPSWMLAQNQRQRRLGRGSFDTLAKAMLTDAATVRWLDGEKNTVKGPNENLAREFMEIFTLGHADGYTENDVRAGSKALTGLHIDPQDGSVSVRARLHDNSTKTLFGRTGDLGVADYGDLVLARPGSPAYIVGRLWGMFVSNTPPDAATQGRLLAAYGPKRDLHALLTAMFTDRSFAAAEGSFIIGPVEWLIGAMRVLHVDVSSAAEHKQLASSLDSLGQLPFYPPSVGGWPTGLVWMSTASADLRFKAATLLAQRAQLPTLPGSTTAKLEALAHLLGVDTWSGRTLAVLKGAVSDPRQLVPIALNTPEYLVH
ncbi:DUF1800 family protein [uncultured Jatrophihabitans sp.]|uniref:DUF1800 domain-containing protein n=1 Tax=uncultured Jatrophihabitans sp. TaxID=1610747 RepID=UPI0035CACB76